MALSPFITTEAFLACASEIKRLSKGMTSILLKFFVAILINLTRSSREKNNVKREWRGSFGGCPATLREPQAHRGIYDFG